MYPAKRPDTVIPPAVATKRQSAARDDRETYRSARRRQTRRQPRLTSARPACSRCCVLTIPPECKAGAARPIPAYRLPYPRRKRATVALCERTRA
ncbi:hypothetical protein DI57_08435 [Enterobacter asburiae L1]|nr:hypothetical protein DI57_08435 [Enterobacter asburiae L1]